MTSNIKPKTIFTGDNLPIMRGMNSESVDLIYLDPPFNSNADYAAPIGSEAAGAEFTDTWTLSDVNVAWLDLIETKHPTLNRVIHASMTNSDKSYLIYMSVRLLEMKRLLKPDGSIYLHCDPTMSHYLKLVMDAIFDKRNYRAEIIWKRHNAHNDKLYGTIHDTIFYYSYGDRNIPTDVLIPLSDERLKDYRYRDERGRYATGDLTASQPRTGESGQSWRSIDPRNRHWAPPRTGKYADYIERKFIPNYRSVDSVHTRLDLLNENDFIYWSESGKPYLKRYLMPDAGQPPQSIWDDIAPVRGEEDTGYPTQKPLALLNRIIKASLSKDGVVFDPFCGCATTSVAADRLQRNWVGIDISAKAAELVVNRIREDQGMFENIITREDIPQRTDLGHIPRYNSLENKTQLYGEQSGYCNGCGTHFQKQHLEVDHIIAENVGGTDHIENLQLLCSNCNRIKGNRGQEYLLSRLNED
jgi:site-specific DNA-methyltransferase (adenine-specific)